MPTHNIYAIRDIKANIFHQPFEMPEDVLAIRSFASATHEKKIMISKFPQDFELYHLGTFNTETGQFNNANPVRCIITGLTAKKMIIEEEDHVDVKQPAA